MLKAFFLLLKSAAPKAEAGLLLRQPEGNGILICQIGAASSAILIEHVIFCRASQFIMDITARHSRSGHEG